ncbi:MAG: citrate (Si)-synthase, partial [Cytophagales bacterium]|nr:citrate (Si)-synthase [Cytophagales bacterium]
MNPTIEHIVSITLNIPSSLIQDDLTYQSIPEWDSQRHVALMLAIEEAYHTEINEDMVLKLTSVAAIKKYVTQHTYSHTQNGSQNTKATTTESLEANQDKSVKVTVHRGLNGIFYDNTHITSIDGQTGRLLHCGYLIDNLAEHSNFEEITYLLLHHRLPNNSELEAFDAEFKAFRIIPDQLIEVIRFVKDAHPTDVLCTAISAISAFETENNVQETFQKGIRLIAQIPIIVTAHHSIRTGREPVKPNKMFSHAANFFYMLKGDIPSEQEIKIMDKDFVLHADHGSNASTFTARIATGAGANLHAAITAAIAAFSGSLHGGALESVMKMLQEIGKPEYAAEYIRKLQEKGLPVPGVGHRVYRADDPRACHLRETAR